MTQKKIKIAGPAGFSLIELMIVVAIIGILATIALPNYQKFQARSRQTSAKSELSAIYTAEKSFFAEYQTYHYDWPTIGFVPEGFQIPNGSTYPTMLSKTRFYASTPSSVGIPAPTTFAQLGLTSIDQFGIFNIGVGSYPAAASKCLLVSDFSTVDVNSAGARDVSMGNNGSITQSTFDARVIGCPRLNATVESQLDRWSITHQRVITNLNSGL